MLLPIVQDQLAPDPESAPHRDGKAPLLEPHPKTADGEDIRADCDFVDPAGASELTFHPLASKVLSR